MTLSSSATYSQLSYPSVKSPASVSESTAAYTRGHTAGYTAGLRTATAESALRRAEMEAEHAAVLRQSEARTDRAIAALQAAVNALDAVTVPVVTQAQDVLMHSALDLAEAVIGYELTQGDLSARAALARVMEHAIQPGTHTLRMNPADLSMLDEAALAAVGLNVIPDPALAPGDATAEFEDGHLDARIGTALARAKYAILGDSE